MPPFLKDIDSIFMSEQVLEPTIFFDTTLFILKGDRPVLPQPLAI